MTRCEPHYVHLAEMRGVHVSLVMAQVALRRSMPPRHHEHRRAMWRLRAMTLAERHPERVEALLRSLGIRHRAVLGRAALGMGHLGVRPTELCVAPAVVDGA